MQRIPISDNRRTGCGGCSGCSFAVCKVVAAAASEYVVGMEGDWFVGDGWARDKTQATGVGRGVPNSSVGRVISGGGEKLDFGWWILGGGFGGVGVYA